MKEKTAKGKEISHLKGYCQKQNDCKNGIEPDNNRRRKGAQKKCERKREVTFPAAQGRQREAFVWRRMEENATWAVEREGGRGRRTKG